METRIKEYRRVGKVVEKCGRFIKWPCCGLFENNDDSYYVLDVIHKLVKKRKEGKKWLWLYKCLRCGDIKALGASHRNFNITKD